MTITITADVCREDLDQGGVQFRPRIFINGKEWLAPEVDSADIAEGLADAMAQSIIPEIEAFLLDNGYKEAPK